MKPFDLRDYRYDALIFDCDGTLANTLPVHYLTFREALAEHGLPLEPDWYGQRTGLSSGKLFDAYEAAFGVALMREGLLARCREIYRTHLDRLEEHGFAAGIARACRGKSPMAVASAGQGEIVRATLGRLGLVDLFDAVVTIEDVRRGKPAPDLYLLAASKLEVPPASCLVFEDSPEGLEAARAAGMEAIDVRPYTPERPLTTDDR
ncbi:HAD family hydrolase [Swaminathania salitolerans]|uniref:Phosphatase n=1 Tax=Swaminathania salitolerans TaxID=182838 RepID=A0A511BS32_9PROT|nr:HAD family phosphatase [Swaminathania salitolerans]GBQ12706.1 phosphatase/phosphohexomutase [Swaminathania salitolerans LMG 21291]GEL03141.1 phosphatase [Swaminathania salitolerans]